jgi:outer membrane receptor protein involved in Fe transport
MIKQRPMWQLSPVAKAISFATLASFSSMQAYAQDENEVNKPEETPLEKQEKEIGKVEVITVTANKRKQDMQKMAQSVQAFDTDQIEKMGFNNFQDYANAIPSLSSVSATPGRNEVVFRGVSTGSQEWRTDSSTAVYLDEIPMTSAAQQVDPVMIDIQRIEALPGPQGTVLGSSSQSGALRIITNKPETDTGVYGSVTAEYSVMEEGDPSHRFEGYLNIPVIEDVFALRVAGFSVEEGGYVDNVLGDDLFGASTNADVAKDNYNTWGQEGGRIIGLWHINEQWDAQFTYLNQSSTTRGDWASDPALGDFKITRFHEDVRTDDWWATALTITGDLGFAQLTYSTSYLDREIFYEFDNTLATQIMSKYESVDYYASKSPYYETAYAKSTLINDQYGKRTTHEMRLASMGESRFQWLVGAFYEETYDEWDWYTVIPGLTETPAWEALNNLAYYNNFNYGLDTPLPLAETDLWYGEDFERTTKQTAIFGEFDYGVTDKLTLGVGLRWFKYDRDRIEYSYFPFGSPYNNLDTGGADYYSGDASDLIKKFSARYEFDDDRMMYFTYSEGFRLGGDNNLRPNSILPDSYDSDKLFNHELGFKSTWFNNQLRFNATLFYMKWEDMQREIQDVSLPNNPSGHANIGEAEIKGLEATLTYFITDDLKIDGSFYASDSQVTDNFYFSSIFEEGVLPEDQDYLVAAAGQDLAISPDRKTWIGIEYNHPEELLGASWWLRYDHSYQSSQSSDWNTAQITAENENTESSDDLQDAGEYIPSSQNANFQVGMYYGDDWQVTFSIWNVWDERGVTWVDYGNDSYLESESVNETRFRSLRNYTRPREFNLSVTYNF